MCEKLSDGQCVVDRKEVEKNTIIPWKFANKKKEQQL